MSFTLICNKCDNKIVLEDGFDRDKLSIFINIYESCDITCKECENYVDESNK